MTFLFVLLALFTTATTINRALSLNILIFGGNGNIGSECVHRLLADKNRAVTVVNRGTPYFDSQQRIFPFVNHVRCDRHALKSCKEFQKYIENVGFVDFVVDFSCYHPRYLTDTLELLSPAGKPNRVGTYIFISTDSVYDLCPKKDKLLSETDADCDPLMDDSYGFRKYACERILKAKRLSGGRPRYVILRLPDVVGPRDTTHRWWTYQKWLEMYDGLGPHSRVLIPSKVSNLRSSLVYVKDVAEVVHLIINAVAEGNSQVLDEVYNVAFDEVFTLRKILDKMQCELNITGVEYKYDVTNEAFHLYPSVVCGAISNEKLKKTFNWKPISWDQAAAETVNFYKKADFPRENAGVMSFLEEHNIIQRQTSLKNEG